MKNNKNNGNMHKTRLASGRIDQVRNLLDCRRVCGPLVGRIDFSTLSIISSSKDIFVFEGEVIGEGRLSLSFSDFESARTELIIAERLRVRFTFSGLAALAEMRR